MTCLLRIGFVKFSCYARDNTSSRSRSGIGRYSLGSIELVPRPWVNPRMIVVYPNISPYGTTAVMTRTLPLSCVSTIWPRRLAKSALTGPK